MQVVIDIPNSLYANISKIQRGSIASKRILDCVRDGTPLPKGHKRLIEDNFKSGPIFDKEKNLLGYRYVTQEDLNSAPTIIEADKAESVDK